MSDAPGPDADVIERIIIRRLHQNRIDGYTLEMSKEIAAALAVQRERDIETEHFHYDAATRTLTCK